MWAAATTAVVTLAALAPITYAYRRAPHRQARAIRAAMLASCPRAGGARRLPFTREHISTANPRYAEGETRDNGCSYLGDILLRPNAHSEHWRIVLNIGDNVQPCTRLRRQVPRAVLNDFGIQGFRGHTGGRPVRC